MRNLLTLCCYFFSMSLIAQASYLEQLDRGLVAVRTSDSTVWLSWRLLASDPPHAGFAVYRDGKPIANISGDAPTSFEDICRIDAPYQVRLLQPGKTTSLSKPVSVWGQNYLRIPLQRPLETDTHSYEPNDASVADLDGDGDYEIILKWNPTNAKDNSQAGHTGPVLLDAYQLDGTLLWRINLGVNIRAGAHYTQFLVYDFESDGMPELVCKTADGTTDGLGNVLGGASADYRNAHGYVLDGPEFLTVFDGRTGAMRASAPYTPARGEVAAWGDGYGNRVDRFLAGVAYLDGERPSIVMSRGYYTRTVVAAWDYREGKLAQRWVFDTDEGYPEYAGKGNHSLSVADVDADGRDEIIFGAMALDDGGKPLHNTTWGHGDALHVSDFDPARPGLEVVMPVEWASNDPAAGRPGLTFRDALTGKLLWGAYPEGNSVDVGRGVCADITATSPGAESWASHGLGLFSAKGDRIGELPTSVNFLVWWDGDLLRELLNGNVISKYGEGELLVASGALSNNGTKATPALCADILGDWREEVILREENNAFLRIYTTTISTGHRFVTLMHDRQYRVGVAAQNVGYNQPAHTSFFFGEGMSAPQRPVVKFPSLLQKSSE